MVRRRECLIQNFAGHLYNQKICKVIILENSIQLTLRYDEMQNIRIISKTRYERILYVNRQIPTLTKSFGRCQNRTVISFSPLTVFWGRVALQML